MHELSISESILESVRKELLQYPGARPTRIGLRIGELAAVDVDSLTFCFESIVRGTEWESLKLEATVCPTRRKCLDCNTEFLVVNYNAACPACESNNTPITSGNELDFDFIEVDMPEASADTAPHTPIHHQ